MAAPAPDPAGSNPLARIHATATHDALARLFVRAGGGLITYRQPRPRPITQGSGLVPPWRALVLFVSPDSTCSSALDPPGFQGRAGVGEIS